ncbi:MAG: methionyl-tRNA formyltransferase [Pseudomonadales bacterium]|nr:methionyl-tRNA formyltransferase [Pseudomonadales bacterium]
MKKNKSSAPDAIPPSTDIRSRACPRPLKTQATRHIMTTLDSLRIVFAGTPVFAARHLQALLDRQCRVVAIYTQADRPAGRGRKLTPSAVKTLAQAHQIPVYQPQDLRASDTQAELKALRPDLLVVVAYGLLLPQAVLDIPRFGCINVHASLLPRWRGAAPIERALLAGDRETGITIMQMSKGLDTGPILLALKTPITAQDNAETLTQRLAGLGCQGLIETLDLLLNGNLRPRAQDEALSSYAGKLSKEEALIDWQLPAAVIHRQIRAFYPRSPAYSYLGNDRIKIIQARPATGISAASPGTIIEAGKEGLLVACANSSLLLETLQLPGKTATPVAAILNAHQDSFRPGTRFQSGAHD